MELDILRICEHRWPENNDLKENRHTFYNFKNTSRITEKKKVLTFKMNFHLTVEILYHIPIRLRSLNSVLELLLRILLSLCTYENITFHVKNAKIRADRTANMVSAFELDFVNDQRDTLYDFYKKNNLVIRNIWLKLPKRKLICSFRYVVM